MSTRSSSRRLRQLGFHMLAAAEPAAVELAQEHVNVHGKPLRATREEAPLTDEEIATFMELGYVALPGILPHELQGRLKIDVDRMETDRLLSRDGGPKVPFIVECEELGKLCSFPPVVDKVEQLMRAYGNGADGCAMHHDAMLNTIGTAVGPLIFSAFRSHYGAKNGFLSHLYINIMILPRQARDKHRESTQKTPVLLQAHPLLIWE